MKNLSIILLAIISLTSCMKVRQIGDLNMISTRNVDKEMDYVLVRSYMGSESKKEVKKEVKRYKCKNLQQAIDITVKNTPGGEFLKNIKIYEVNYKYFVAIGDVWGNKVENHEYKGFKVGDKVQYKKGFSRKTGVIVDLKDSDRATVKEDLTGKSVLIEYSKMLKSN